MLTYPAAAYGINRPQIYANNNYRIRPVTSIEEVKASPIDFDGSVFYFHDIASKRIFTKQINLEGMVQIDTYELTIPEPIVTNEVIAQNYVTREEFQLALQDILSQMKGDTKNESITTNTEFDF